MNEQPKKIISFVNNVLGNKKHDIVNFIKILTGAPTLFIRMLQTQYTFDQIIILYERLSNLKTLSCLFSLVTFLKVNKTYDRLFRNILIEYAVGNVKKKHTVQFTNMMSKILLEFSEDVRERLVKLLNQKRFIQRMLMYDINSLLKSFFEGMETIVDNINKFKTDHGKDETNLKSINLCFSFSKYGWEAINYMAPVKCSSVTVEEESKVYYNILKKREREKSAQLKNSNVG